MQVLVMRHGIALERQSWAEHDSLRPLSKKGEKKVRLASRGLKYLCPHIDLIASSPLLRARQTADIARRALEALRPVEIWDEAALLVEEAVKLEPLLERLRAFALEHAEENLLLIGHEPGCSRLLSLLLCSDADAVQFSWKKAGVACLEADGERGVLRWLAGPKMLRALGRTAGR